MTKLEESLIDGEIIFTPEQHLMGIIELKDKSHLFFELRHTKDGKTLNQGDQVVVTQVKRIGKAILRPTEISYISEELRSKIEKRDLKLKILTLN